MVFLTYELNRLLKPHGFVRRGTAFFRVHGDGILQVVKFNRERSGEKELCIGLFSLYSELDLCWFTGRGCIPRYPIVNILGQRWESVCRFELDYHNSLIKQLNVLCDAGIPWLNQIETPLDMSRGVHYLETSWGGSYIWNDSFKIAPYLRSGELENARRVVQAILDQHNMAYKANRELYKDEEEYKNYLRPWLEQDRALYDLRSMIERGDAVEIEAYLRNNYEKNLPYASFCMKRGAS